MTKDEAIRLLSGLMFKGKLKEALDIAIEALKAEPCECEHDHDTLKAYDKGFDDGLEEGLKVGACEDAIRRQAVDELFYKAITSTSVNLDEHWKKLIWVREHVKELPSVTPARKIGHWVSVNTGKRIMLKDGMSTESVKCSECDEWLTASDEYACYGRYCPNCGAKMQEVEK